LRIYSHNNLILLPIYIKCGEEACLLAICSVGKPRGSAEYAAFVMANNTTVAAFIVAEDVFLDF
jgi:hypothetical protein